LDFFGWVFNTKNVVINLIKNQNFVSSYKDVPNDYETECIENETE